MGKSLGIGEKYLDLCLYSIAISLIKFFYLFPFSFACRVGELLGMAWFYLYRRHRVITLENLEKAFGQKFSRTQRVSLAKKTYQNFGRIFMECIFLPRFTAENIRKFVSITGIENLHEADKQGKGLFFITAHFGNWELLAVALAYYGFFLSEVARPLPFPSLDKLLEGHRTQCGNRVIARKGAVKGILKCLHKRERVGILLDQNAYGRGAVFVDFFGLPASTLPIVAALSQKTGAPVVPVFMVPRKKSKGYIIEVGKMIDLIKSGDKEKDIIFNTARYTHVIEEYIRKYPHYWFWMLRRWKTRPDTQLQQWGKIRQMREPSSFNIS